MAQGLLVNLRWCIGCHSCEIACQTLRDLPPEQTGIKVETVGPWSYGEGGDKHQYTCFPLLTDQCNLCARRQAEGKAPSCVQHCQTSCIQIMDAAEAAEIVKDNGDVLFMRL